MLLTYSQSRDLQGVALEASSLFFIVINKRFRETLPLGTILRLTHEEIVTRGAMAATPSWGVFRHQNRVKNTWQGFEMLCGSLGFGSALLFHYTKQRGRLIESLHRAQFPAITAFATDCIDIPVV